MVITGTIRKLFFVVTMLLTAGAVEAQSNGAVQTLVDQGQYWQSVADWEKAETSWKKVLLSDRNHPEALRGLFYNELQRGRLTLAGSYRDQLVDAHPGHAFIEGMNKALVNASEGVVALDEARKLVQAGDVADGLIQYRLSFGDRDPNGNLAVEYYATLGGTDEGWQEAADGLARLAQTNPDDWSYELAYAKHLTYRQPSRRKGIDRLIALGENEVSRATVTPLLKQALLWMPESHQDISRYQGYLALAPEDAEMLARLKVLRSSRTPQQETQLQEGFAAMENSTPDDAAERFERLLRARPRDSDALIGLGLVEQRRGNFERSARLISDALKYRGGERSDWRKALNTSRYWAHIETARELMAEDSTEGARAELVEALRINDKDEVGLVMMAETLHLLGKSEDAERFYMRAIDQNPANAVALRGLGKLYNETERFDDAEMLALRLNKEFAGSSDPVADEILAQGLVAKGRTLLEQDELDLAQIAFEQALKKQNSNPWIRLELAQLLVRRNRADRAQLLMEEMAEAMPDSAAALHAQAEFAYLLGQYGDALAFLEKIVVGERTAQMSATQNRIWLRLQVQRAVRFAQNNNFAQARRTLGEAENVAGSEPDMAGSLATGWIELGEDERALSIMRTALKLRPEIDLQIQYAGLLLKTRKDQELNQVLKNLKARTDLDEIQLRETAHIELSLALRQADRFLRDRQFAQAYSSIEPFIDRNDDNPETSMMLGRLYQSTGDLPQALSNYNQILQSHPGHLDARRAAVGALIDARQYDRAQALVNEGLELFPDHPRMVLLAGQLEASQGRPTSALAYFKKSLLLITNGENAASLSQLPAGTGQLSGSRQYASTADAVSLLDVLDTHSALALDSVMGLREEVLAEIGNMNARTSSFFQIGGLVGNRSGESGLDKLSVFRLPVRFEYGIGNSGRVSLEATVETLDADDLELSNVVSANRFGALALDTSLPREDTVSVSENGLGLYGQYQSRYVTVDIGTTPTDYPVSNVIGGISATNGDEKLKFTGSVSRRPVQDSTLSYAGRVDPFLGVVWGGVVRTGGDFSVTIDKQNQGFYASAGAYAFEGENVVSNSMTQLGVGVFWRLKQTKASSLRVGLDIDSFSYDKNLSFHTFGHGGYFSPQSYINIGVPLKWSGESGQLSYGIDAKIGFERFSQDDVAFFPGNAALQLQLEELAQTASEPQLTQHRGSSDTGVSISLRGEMVYQVSPKLALGSSVLIQSSGDYDESRIGLFARYFFAPQAARLSSPVNQAEILVTQRGL